MDSENNDFLWKANNWNQVCNAAMVIGALALYEDDEEFAKEIITRSVSFNKTGSVRLWNRWKLSGGIWLLGIRHFLSSYIFLSIAEGVTDGLRVVD